MTIILVAMIQLILKIPKEIFCSIIHLKPKLARLLRQPFNAVLVLLRAAEKDVLKIQRCPARTSFAGAKLAVSGVFAVRLLRIPRFK